MEKGRRAIACVLLAMTVIFAGPVRAEITPAATTIVNTAALTHGPGDARVTVSSNSVALRVDTVIDVAVVARAQTLSAPPGATNLPIAFVVTNLGNADESFTLAARSDVALTVRDDSDTLVTAITLAPAASRTVFVVATGPMDRTTEVALTVTAVTGHGAPGTIVARDGADAIVGTTGGAATAQTVITVGDDQPTLTKSQTVTAPDGSPRAMPQSVITYRLDARFPDATRDVRIVDDIPAGTVFVPGSIVIDGRPMTDAQDADAASFDGAAVHVVLGDIASAAARTILFQTKIE